MQIYSKLIAAFTQNDAIPINVLRNASVSFGIRIGSVGLTFLFQIVLARILGVNEFGIYTYVWSWFLLLSIPATLGLDLASVRFVASYLSQEDLNLLKGYIASSTCLAIGTSIIVAIFSSLTISILFRLSLIPINVATCLFAAQVLIPLYALLTVQSGYLRGANRIAEALLTQSFTFQSVTLVLVVAMDFVTPIRPTAVTVFVLSCISTVITIIWQQVLMRRHLPIYTPVVSAQYQNREWITVTTTIMFNTGLYQIFNQLDTIAVGAFLGTSSAGIYGVAVRLIRLIGVGFDVANQATAHLFAPLHEKGNRQGLQQAVFLNAKIRLAFALGATVILLIWSHPILSLFGSSYIAATPIVGILLIGYCVGGVAGPNGILLQLTGYQRELLVTLGGTLIAYIILLSLLLPTKGLVGVALATTIALSIQNVIVSIRVWQYLAIIPTVLARSAWRWSAA